jgi:Uma2 family endonuclease
MAEPKPRRTTYQDVLDAPEHMVAEIFDGELVLSPRPAGPHSAVHTLLMGDLVRPFMRGGGDGPGGWIILTEPELHLDNDICVPDIGGWRRDRMPDVGEEAYFTIPPDWVCEVLSRSTERHDRMKKLRIYARAGIEYAWLVSPRMRSLEVLRQRDGVWSLIAMHLDEERVRGQPFEAIELDLAMLWRDFRPPTHAAEGAAVYDIW